MLFIVSHKLGGFKSNLFKGISNEGVQDLHGLLGNTGLWVNLLEDSVDVHREGLSSLSLVLLVSSSLSTTSLLLFGSGGSFGGSTLCCFLWGHL